MARAKAKPRTAANAKAKPTASRRAPARKAARAKSTRAKSARTKSAHAKPAATRRPKHSFNVSHPRDDDFEGGLRRYAKYRDLGMAKATGGMVQAHVIRFVPPFIPEEVSKLHFHDVELQMVYVLKGWIETELEGQGAHVMRAGSCWLQPPKIKHKVLNYSDDCEVLEIVLPAEFDTVELE
jgi:quercetin dioxygenase-like cupin family protein